MDFGGNWRLLHYTMKRMYAPCLISAHRNRTSGQIEVWLVSDINEPATGESCLHICIMYIRVLHGITWYTYQAFLCHEEGVCDWP